MTVDVRHVALIGMMGSGKTTVGSRLAQRLGWPFLDSDSSIQERTGMTVRELWERGGEQAYRPLERAAVVTALTAPVFSVVAVPGGAVLDPEASEALRRPDVVVVWLRATDETLLRRVESADHRPLLGKDPAAVLPRLAAERTPRYRRLADVVVDVDDVAPDDAAAVVLRAIDRLGVTLDRGSAARR